MLAVGLHVVIALQGGDAAVHRGHEQRAVGVHDAVAAVLGDDVIVIVVRLDGGVGGLHGHLVVLVQQALPVVRGLCVDPQAVVVRLADLGIAAGEQVGGALGAVLVVAQRLKALEGQPRLVLRLAVGLAIVGLTGHLLVAQLLVGGAGRVVIPCLHGVVGLGTLAQGVQLRQLLGGVAVVPQLGVGLLGSVEVLDLHQLLGLLVHGGVIILMDPVGLGQLGIELIRIGVFALREQPVGLQLLEQGCAVLVIAQVQQVVLRGHEVVALQGVDGGLVLVGAHERIPAEPAADGQRRHHAADDERAPPYPGLPGRKSRRLFLFLCLLCDALTLYARLLFYAPPFRLALALHALALLLSLVLRKPHGQSVDLGNLFEGLLLDVALEAGRVLILPAAAAALPQAHGVLGRAGRRIGSAVFGQFPFQLFLRVLAHVERLGGRQALEISAVLVAPHIAVVQSHQLQRDLEVGHVGAGQYDGCVVAEGVPLLGVQAIILEINGFQFLAEGAEALDRDLDGADRHGGDIFPRELQQALALCPVAVQLRDVQYERTVLGIEAAGHLCDQFKLLIQCIHNLSENRFLLAYTLRSKPSTDENINTYSSLIIAHPAVVV